MSSLFLLFYVSSFLILLQWIGSIRVQQEYKDDALQQSVLSEQR